MNSGTLTDGRVRLFCLNSTAKTFIKLVSYLHESNKLRHLKYQFNYSHFLQNNSFGMRRTCKRLLPFITKMTLLVSLISPPLIPPVGFELAPGSHSSSFSSNHNSQQIIILKKLEIGSDMIFFLKKKQQMAHEHTNKMIHCHLNYQHL